MTDSAFVILVEILLSIILVIIVLGNLFVIEAVCRHVRLKTIPNICITSLAIADLFVGLLNIPMYMYAVYDDAFEQKYPETFILVLNSLDMYFGFASILHLAFISMERCYAITCPLRRRFLQKATVIKILIGLWVTGIIPVVLYVLDVSYAQAVILVGCFLIPLIVIITSYIILMISAKLSWKKMEEYRAQQTTKDFRLAKTLCIVVVVFIITWTPFFIALVISVYPEHITLNLTPGQMMYFAYFGKFSQYASSACNPFIYAFRQREFTAHAHYLCRSLTNHHRRLNRSLVREAEGSRTSTRTTRSLFNRLSKASEKPNEQYFLCRMNNDGHDGEKKRANEQQCPTRV